MIDMKVKMTIYELLALVASFSALIGAPLVKYFWNKYFKKAKVFFHENGDAFIYFNRSGAYIRINGVIESQRKAIILRKINVSIIRKNDHAQRELEWATFYSPVTQNGQGGSYVQITETAHPFGIVENGIVPSFTEYSDLTNASYNAISSAFVPAERLSNQYFQNGLNFDEAKEKYLASKEYAEYQKVVAEEFFWKNGKYSVELNMMYNDNSMSNQFVFTLDDSSIQTLKNSMKELTLLPLYSVYSMSSNIVGVRVLLHRESK